MKQRAPLAGGLFIAVGILGGFALGIVTGTGMTAVLAGAALGLALAALVWLLDRRR